MTRYAVYYIPEENSDLYRIASELLGRCIYTGNALPQPLIRGFDMEALTTESRKYGLHATLKAPFKINCDEETLLDAFHDFCAQQVPARLHNLKLALLGTGFWALTGDMSPELSVLEERCVKAFQSYARPLTQKEVIRRQAKSVKELLYLNEWGYHKIFDQFRFHITFTNTLPPLTNHKLREGLVKLLKPYLDQTLVIDRLALCRQMMIQGPFTVLAQARFTNVNAMDTRFDVKYVTAA